MGRSLSLSHKGTTGKTEGSCTKLLIAGKTHGLPVLPLGMQSKRFSNQFRSSPTLASHALGSCGTFRVYLLLPLHFSGCGCKMCSKSQPQLGSIHVETPFKVIEFHQYGLFKKKDTLKGILDVIATLEWFRRTCANPKRRFANVCEPNQGVRRCALQLTRKGQPKLANPAGVLRTHGG